MRNQWKQLYKSCAAACLLCIAVLVMSAAPVFGISYTTDGFFTTIEVKEDSSMHVTEEIYVTFITEAHGIYRYIPYDNVQAFFVRNGELDSQEMVYKIQNLTVEGEQFKKEATNGDLMVRIGSADKTVLGAHKYTIEYDILMYEDGIGDFDQFYWNVIPTYWETDIRFAAFVVHMPKAYDLAETEVITGPVGTGDTERANWDVDDEYVLAGHVDGLERGEGITVRIMLPQGYWVGAKTETKLWRIAQGALGVLTAFVVGMFLKHGKDPKPVETVEFYPPDKLSSADIGYIYDARVGDKDMTSLVMWFASQGYLKIHASTEETRVFKFEQTKITLEKVQPIPKTAPLYQQTFFNALFRDSKFADMEVLSKSTPFADSYEAAKSSLQDRYDAKSHNQLQEGYGYTALGCLSFILMCAVFVLSLAFLHIVDKEIKILLGEFVIGGLLVLLCTVFMSRPTAYRMKMLGRIRGFRSFIAKAELDRIEALVEQDPDYYYNILPYAYVFGLTDKWAKHFEKLTPHVPEWYDGPAAYFSSPSVFCRSMDTNVRSALSESIIHTTSNSMSGGSHSSGGGFSGGGGGGGGGGAW